MNLYSSLFLYSFNSRLLAPTSKPHFYPNSFREELMQNVLLNLKLALRRLRNMPGFTATTVLMLAFGIGSTTVIFSIVKGVLLRPLPFPEPGRLVIVGDHLPSCCPVANAKIYL